MILQDTGTAQYVYMPDIDAGRISLGHAMGLCDAQGVPAEHAYIRKKEIITDCGGTVTGWHMTGQTVNVFVIPSRVYLKSGLAVDMAGALNSFIRPRYDFGRYSFTGKFRPVTNGKTYTVIDKMGRGITTHADAIKDFPGIFELMGHLGDNNGALFQPVIARYMWGIWHLKGRVPKYQPIGYLDLMEYLSVMRDSRREMFSRIRSNALLVVQLGEKPYVEVKSVDPKTGQAILEFGDVTVFDREMDNNFRPYVLVSNKPIEIHSDLKFQWSKVECQGHSVFLIPVMSKPSTWTQNVRAIDLLSPSQRP